MDDIETLIQEAKGKRDLANKVQAMQELDEEGILPKGNSESREITAYERAADTIVGGLHKVDDAKNVLQHSNIPGKVLPPVLEIIIITESMIAELFKFAGIKKLEPLEFYLDENGKPIGSTLDPLTLEEDIILVQEAIRIMEAIPLVLTAKDGFRSLQAVENLRSVVTGQNILDSNQSLALGIGQSKGVMHMVRSFFPGGKKKK